MPTSASGLHEALFRCQDGSIVYGQSPNVPMYGFIGAALLGFVPGLSPEIKTAAYGLSLAFIFTWAYLELRYGSNLFRRILGATALLFILSIIIFVLPATMTLR